MTRPGWSYEPATSSPPMWQVKNERGHHVCTLRSEKMARDMVYAINSRATIVAVIPKLLQAIGDLMPGIGRLALSADQLRNINESEVEARRALTPPSPKGREALKASLPKLKIRERVES